MKPPRSSQALTLFTAGCALVFAVASFAEPRPRETVPCPAGCQEIVAAAPEFQGSVAERRLSQDPEPAKGPASRPADSRAPEAPAAPLVLVGSKAGAMEPCGCTGGQLGGLARLKTQLDLVCQANPGAVVLDCGGLTKGNSPMERIRGEVMAGIYQLLPTTAVALGPDDLSSGIEEASIRAQIMRDESLTGRFPSALQVNVATGRAVAAPLVAAALVRARSGEKGECRILLTSVAPEEGSVDAAAAAVHAEADQHRGRFDLLVSVFHGSREAARVFGAAAPELDLVVVTQGSGTPDADVELRNGTLYFHPGLKGRHVVHLTLSRSSGMPKASQISVDVVHTNIPADPAAAERIRSYRERLAEEKIAASLAGARPAPALGYAGSGACQECHRTAYEVWAASKHAHAVESMVERRGEQDPDCLKCHALGWYSEPPSGERQGYKADDPKGKLANVGCESCHGPALRHTKSPYTVKPVRDVTCQKCHDVENSPDFDRAKYWPKILHGKDPK